MSGEYCACGIKLNQFTGDNLNTETIWENGKIVYARCAHGRVIVDLLFNNPLRKSSTGAAKNEITYRQ